MIIIIKGSSPDIFKDDNIGTLSTWIIQTNLGNGATYNGPNYVDKNAVLNTTITIAEGYELNGSATVTMGGTPVTEGITINGNTITISIASVTGNVLITVPTKNTVPEEPDTPATYTITYKYVDTSGATIKANTTETVTAGTVKNFTTSNAAAINGYTISSVSPQSATINSNITVTYTYNAVIPSGTTVFDFDFTTKTLNDYVTDGVITIPSTSKTDSLVYDDKGLTTTATGTGASLVNGAKLTNTFDIARDWTFEITMTIDPWQEDFGMTEALYNNFMFVTAPEHEMPLEDGKNHGSNCFTPGIYDNGGTFTGRFPKNGSVGISGASKTITADGIEHTYKWVHTESDQNNAFYKDGTKERDTKWTNTSFTFGGQFGYVLGAHNGYSSAANFCLKKGFHIKSMKLYTN